MKSIRILLLALALCLTSFALTSGPALAWEPCSDPDLYEWRQDGCCSGGYTYFQLWQCNGSYWVITTTYKCGAPPYC